MRRTLTGNGEDEQRESREARYKPQCTFHRNLRRGSGCVSCCGLQRGAAPESRQCPARARPHGQGGAGLFKSRDLWVVSRRRIYGSADHGHRVVQKGVRGPRGAASLQSRATTCGPRTVSLDPGIASSSELAVECFRVQDILLPNLRANAENAHLNDQTRRRRDDLPQRRSRAC